MKSRMFAVILIRMIASVCTNLKSKNNADRHPIQYNIGISTVDIFIEAYYCT